MTIIDDKKVQFENAIQHLKDGLKQIRTGRANSALVENLTIDYYGTKTPLQQLANINIPDSKSIIIQPWDKNSLKDIEKAIHDSPLGLNPINEGNIIRLPIPPLTEERRKELSKIVNEKVEQAKISVRNVREEIWKNIKEQKNDGKISEDDMYGQQKELQKKVEEYNDFIKKIGQEKEKEIMTI
jgi:ribosome recycling factor